MKSLVKFLTILQLAAPAAAADVTVTLRDGQGNPLEDAVVWALPRPAHVVKPRTAAVEQRNKAFVPLVSVVQVGTPVSFPNRDEIRHHVYSFSPAKRFELKLYAGTPADPIVFDKPGEVVLGCNIHDHMIAYIYVVETPWFAKSGKDGRARIDGLPPGEYDLNAWHYAQAGRPVPQALNPKGEEPVPAAFSIPLRPMPPRPAPK